MLGKIRNVGYSLYDDLKKNIYKKKREKQEKEVFNLIPFQDRPVHGSAWWLVSVTRCR